MSIYDMDGWDAIRLIFSRVVIFIFVCALASGLLVGAAAIVAVVYGIIRIVAWHGYGIDLPNPLTLVSG